MVKRTAEITPVLGGGCFSHFPILAAMKQTPSPTPFTPPPQESNFQIQKMITIDIKEKGGTHTKIKQRNPIQ